MKYDAQEYVDAFHQEGKYPKIHDNIFDVCKQFIPTDTNVMDLGACTGLLSMRLIQQGVARKVVGLEPNKKSLSRAVKHPDITYYNVGVTGETIPRMRSVFHNYGVQAIVARRVFPEIVEHAGVNTLKTFARIASECEVDLIILEGRVETKRATSMLSAADTEVKAISQYYEQVFTHKNVRVMKRREAK